MISVDEHKKKHAIPDSKLLLMFEMELDVYLRNNKIDPEGAKVWRDCFTPDLRPHIPRLFPRVKEMYENNGWLLSLAENYVLIAYADNIVGD